MNDPIRSAAKATGGSGPVPCRSCGVTVFFFYTRSGKQTPIESTGETHFANCPGADRHRNKR